MGNGLVCVPRGAAWLPAFKLEYAAFTADNSHQHDDQVDAGSLGFNSLTQEVEPTPWVPTVLIAIQHQPCQSGGMYCIHDVFRDNVPAEPCRGQNRRIGFSSQRRSL